MAWSTREIAELAGTSLRAVRHYHQIGLLPEPERSSNNYKQYGVAHIVRLVWIKRLVDLGFSLPQIAAMDDSSDHPEEALRALDAELAATITRLEQARVEVGILLRTAAPTDLPPEFIEPDVAAKLSDADEATRQNIAESLVPYLRAIYVAHPGLSESRADAPGGARFANETIAAAMSELYNAAQLDILRRAGALMRDSPP